jgi:thiamine pyrophosphokinase
LTAEEQEEEDISATKNEIKFMKQQDVSSTRNALRLAQQAEETGRDTLARLGAQGERIHKYALHTARLEMRANMGAALNATWILPAHRTGLQRRRLAS